MFLFIDSSVLCKGCPKKMLPILWSGFTCTTWRDFMCHNVPYSESRVQVLAFEGPSCASTWRAFMCHNVSVFWEQAPSAGRWRVSMCSTNVPFLWTFSMIYRVSVIFRNPDSNNIEDGHLQGGDLKVKQAVVYLLSPIHHCCRCSLSLLLKYPSN